MDYKHISVQEAGMEEGLRQLIELFRDEKQFNRLRFLYLSYPKISLSEVIATLIPLRDIPTSADE